MQDCGMTAHLYVARAIHAAQSGRPACVFTVFLLVTLNPYGPSLRACRPLPRPSSPSRPRLWLRSEELGLRARVFVRHWHSGCRVGQRCKGRCYAWGVWTAFRCHIKGWVTAGWTGAFRRRGQRCGPRCVGQALAPGGVPGWQVEGVI